MKVGVSFFQKLPKFSKVLIFPKNSKFPKFFGTNFVQEKPDKVVDKYQQLNEIYMKKNLKRKMSPGQVQF